MENSIQNITTNRKAYHDYDIIDKLEAGIELTGSEVKSIRAGHVSIQDSYGKIVNGEAFLYKMNVKPYDYGGYTNHEPERPRRLLLHKKEIRKIEKNLEMKGITLIPLRVYVNPRGKIKVELGLARGKRQHDKRAAIAERELKRELEYQKKLVR